MRTVQILWLKALPSLTLPVLLSMPLNAQEPPLLSKEVIDALDAELSGSEARRTVQELTLHHRMRGSKQFRAAAEAIRRRVEAYGLEGAEILEFPADGKRFYGTQRSRPAWDAEFAELWELRRDGEKWVDSLRIASWEDRPVSLAQDSVSGEATAPLVDVGMGTQPSDYEGKEVSGKLVLVAAQPGSAVELAVGRYGAAGIVSYAQNQVTAWWKQDETLVRWGHLGTFPEPKTFAFMVSLRQARRWQERLAAGEEIWLRASVRAGQRPGSYDIVTALIPGRDPAVADQQIVFSCHLDHQRPGANDNASGCAAILEVARSLQNLVENGKIPPPRRTLRFVWPPEIEGTQALLTGLPELAQTTRAVVHLDMVGGGETTKAIFHITRSPASLPTFVNDVAEALGRYVVDQSDEFASTGKAEHPLIDPFGARDVLMARVARFSMGSDHQVYTEGSFRIPAIYLNDWPDRYIHTHKDSVDNIDATKLKRSAFVAAASGYYLARLGDEEVPRLWETVRRHALERAAEAMKRSRILAKAAGEEAASALLRHHLEDEAAVLESIEGFAAVSTSFRMEADAFYEDLRRLLGRPSQAGPDGRAARGKVYRRRPAPQGPLSVFGYDYLQEQLQRLGLPVPALLSHQGIWGGGGEYAYEALNLVDGRRGTAEIAQRLTSYYGPVAPEMVREFLETLAKIGVLE